MADQEEITLVCMPIEVGALTARGAVYDKRCLKCGTLVRLAPSGQRFLKANPEAVLLCINCYTPNPDAEQRFAASSTDELLDEVRTAIPNPHFNRN